MINLHNAAGKTITVAILLLTLLVVGTNCQQQPGNVSKPISKDADSSNSPNDQAWRAARQAEKILQNGDLVMRSDDDLESLALQNFSNNDRTYSHSGIAFIEEGHFVIYHCMTGAENPSGSCRRDPVDSFIDPAKKTGFGIFRYQLSAQEIEKLHAITRSNHEAKIPFDISFNINSNDSLYCSEMIYKALKIATKNRVVLPTSILTNFKPKIVGYRYNQTFFKKFEYISLDNLYLNEFCKEVTSVKYR